MQCLALPPLLALGTAQCSGAPGVMGRLSRGSAASAAGGGNSWTRSAFSPFLVQVTAGSSQLGVPGTVSLISSYLQRVPGVIQPAAAHTPLA